MSRSNSHPSRSAHQFGGRFTGQNRVTMLFLAATHGRAASDLIDRLRSRVEGPAPASDPMRHGRSISVPFESMNRYHSHVDNVMTGCRDVVARRLTSVKDQSARPAAGPQLGAQLVDCLFTPGSTGLTDSNFKRNQKRKNKANEWDECEGFRPPHVAAPWAHPAAIERADGALCIGLAYLHTQVDGWPT